MLHTTPHTTRTITYVHIMCLLAATALPIHAADEPCLPHLPGAIETTDDLRRHLETMLQRSATFRQQCQRLEVPGLRVQIRREPQIADGPYQARTIFRRSSTVIVASVTINGFGDPTEWLAHEIEHVLEQVDGVDIQRLARTTGAAWLSFGNAFETSRAIHAGRTVRREVRDANLPPRSVTERAGRRCVRGWCPARDPLYESRFARCCRTGL